MELAGLDSLDALRLSEGMLTILLAAGVPARSAAWAIDAAFLYVSAYCFEFTLRALLGGLTPEQSWPAVLSSGRGGSR
ncbi:MULTISPECIES: hypothetical protein [unclassified Streptomyces]|uniref:hypothetical protein n=1 Tax=unclassified Streptomyces TaxID=2593676 RepID=UPI001874FC04|nr:MULTISPECIES: hypothetical protein [unclassified Streptomyces]